MFRKSVFSAWKTLNLTSNLFPYLDSISARGLKNGDKKVPG